MSEDLHQGSRRLSMVSAHRAFVSGLTALAILIQSCCTQRTTADRSNGEETPSALRKSKQRRSPCMVVRDVRYWDGRFVVQLCDEQKSRLCDKQGARQWYQVDAAAGRLRRLKVGQLRKIYSVATMGGAPLLLGSGTERRHLVAIKRTGAWVSVRLPAAMSGELDGLRLVGGVNRALVLGDRSAVVFDGRKVLDAVGTKPLSEVYTWKESAALHGEIVLRGTTGLEYVGGMSYADLAKPPLLWKPVKLRRLARRKARPEQTREQEERGDAGLRWKKRGEDAVTDIERHEGAVMVSTVDNHGSCRTAVYRGVGAGGGAMAWEVVLEQDCEERGILPKNSLVYDIATDPGGGVHLLTTNGVFRLNGGSLALEFAVRLERTDGELYAMAVDGKGRFVVGADRILLTAKKGKAGYKVGRMGIDRSGCPKMPEVPVPRDKLGPSK